MNIETCDAINHDGAICIAYASFLRNDRELGVYRSNTGYEVVLAEISGESELPVELERVPFRTRKPAQLHFNQMLKDELR